MGLLERLRPARAAEVEPVDPRRMTLGDLVEQVQWMGNSYPLGLQQTMTGGKLEEPDTSFTGMVTAGYRAAGPVFACILARALLFSEARFQWQTLDRGRPGAMFGDQGLRLLEQPWPNGTTGELLWRAEQDVSLAGNFYLRLSAGRLWRLRPDRMTIVLGSMEETDDPSAAVDAQVVGYLYSAGPGERGTVLLPDEIAHWSPIPDPLASYRGMSWLTPVLADVDADRSSTTHKGAFFRNAATPNLVVMPDATVSFEEFKKWKDEFTDQHEGSWNAYKTLFLGGGSKVQQVGLDFKSMDFKGIQGIGETRIASAAGVPPIIAGFSEGLASATYSNYGMARRKFGDHWARPQWRSFAAAVEHLLARPRGGAAVRLWYDDRDIAFLREDQGDEANIRQTQATTIETLIRAGYAPDAAVAYANTGNPDVLTGQHSGLMSVQLVPPGTGVDPADGGRAIAPTAPQRSTSLWGQ